MNAEVIPMSTRRTRLSPLPKRLWHWIISGLDITFLTVFLLLLLVSSNNKTARPGALEWLTSTLSLLTGIANWSILGELLETGNPAVHRIVVYFVQGLSWTALAFTVHLKPEQRMLSQVLRSWRAANFVVVTCMAVYAGHALVRHRDISTEVLVALASWPACCLLLCCSQSEQEDNHDVESRLSEPLIAASSSSGSSSSSISSASYHSAGVFSRMFFTWINPLLALGNMITLEARHIPELAQEDQAEAAYATFRCLWNRERLKEKPSLCRVLRLCYGKALAWNGGYALLKSLMLSAGPFVMRVFIDYAQGDVYFKYEGYVLVLALFVAKLGESLAQRQWYFGSRRIGMHMRSALIAAIFHKELKLSSIGRQKHSAGEVVSYMAVDAYRVGEFPFWFHLMWATPLQIILGLIILYFSVGLGMLAGLVIVILSMIINFPMASKQQTYQNELMVAQDERLRATSEVLRHLKIVKLQAWEPKFRAMIDKLREVEISWLSALQYKKTYNSLVFWLSPILVASGTFTACWLLHIPLTASNVFTAIATFRIIQEPIRAVPDVVAVVIQARVSLARIAKFLEDHELATDAVIHRSPGAVPNAVELSGATFTWATTPAAPAALRNITMTVKHGGRVAICGEVGSGKSTLIAAILGEAPKTAGKVVVSGRTALVPQLAWIQGGTIRDNILFGLPMDEDRYRRAIRACALDKDLESFAYRDLTEIGERGLNVSGGQKQRIQLARAVYQNADIYLLDDPFSAVDAHTCSSIFKNCIMGVLAKKTLILVTHQVEVLSDFDTILLLRDGEICQAGTYEQILKPNSAFEKLVKAHNEVMGVTRVAPSQVNQTAGGTAILLRKLSSAKSFKDSYVGDETKLDQLTKQEEREAGDAGTKPYHEYLRQGRGFLFCFLAGLSHTIFVIGQMASNWWLASEVGNKAMSMARLIGVYSAIGLGTVSFLLLRSIFIVLMGLGASGSLFAGLMTSLFEAPMGFFDTTPSGRILSRVSVDMSIVDVEFPFSLGYAIAASVNSLSSLSITAAVTWQILVIIVPMLYLNRLLQTYYLAAARELMRINGTTKSPLVNHFGEGIMGALTIRAFKKQEQFMKATFRFIDSNCKPFFYMFSANEWLVLRMEALCAAVVCSSAFIMVLLPSGTIDPGFVGLAISYGLSLNLSLVFSVQHQCTLANYIVSVERIKQYLNLPSEAPAIIEGSRPPASWPSLGTVEIQDLQISYRPGCPLVLRNITCTIGAGQKIGVVGRSGSGKTTLITALFRIVEPAGGKIIIDDIDITTIGLADLRSKLGIIPQEPTLFRGTVRFNLDPQGLYTDSQIWEALDKCKLGQWIREKSGQLGAEVGDDGENWSVGQRQLFCLGRVLLKNSRILILDEATASIDNATDAVLQRLLREEFEHCTVITVAHRIPTVIDSDMVLALSQGVLVEYDQPSKLLENKASLFAKLVAEFWSNSSQVNM